MAEYVTKEPCKSCVHKKACETWMRYLKTIHNDDDYSTYNCPDYLSTADVEPVKRGRWLPQIVLGTRVWDCSECKTIGNHDWKRCPVCEAKMIEEVKHER